MRVSFDPDFDGDAVAYAELPDRPAFPDDESWAKFVVLSGSGSRYSVEAVGAGGVAVPGEWADVSQDIALSEFLIRAVAAGAEFCKVRDESAGDGARSVDIRLAVTRDGTDSTAKHFMEALLETDRETMIEAWTILPDDALRAPDFARAVDHLRHADPRELVDGARFVVGSHCGDSDAIFTVRSGGFHFRRVGSEAVVEIELPDPGYVAKAVREAIEAGHTEVIIATNQ